MAKNMMHMAPVLSVEWNPYRPLSKGHFVLGRPVYVMRMRADLYMGTHCLQNKPS